MDDTTQKPFACKAKDCQMSFTNEDHLNVHEKKHEMVLNLGLTNKAGSTFVADQTPTPTRLIKNCEEVGLFEDLKDVNPFDETFRRAVESQSNSSTPIVETPVASNSDNPLISEESLHTPQVFPNFEGSSAEHCQDFKVEKKNIILAENLDCKQKKLCKKTTKKKPKLQTIKPKSQVQSPKPQSVLIAQNSPVLAPNTINIIQPSQIIAFNITSPSVIQSRPLILPKLTSNEQKLLNEEQIPVKEKLKAHLNCPKVATVSPPTKVPIPFKPKNKAIYQSKELDYDDSGERRRAAASRYRKKIKKEQLELRRKNAELLSENSELKAMVKQLRQALLAHQNCDVSRASAGLTTPIANPPQVIKATTVPMPIIIDLRKLIAQNPIVKTK